MIKLIACDIDGVLTDGKIYISNQGESKCLCFKDMDAVSELKALGFGFALITGEDDFFAHKARERFEPDIFVSACKDKSAAIQKIADQEGFSLDEICYIGDGKYDVETLAIVGLGLCPSNAIDSARENADCILHSAGGEGCLYEAVQLISRHCKNNHPT